MCHYTHLTPFEREKILFFLAEGKSITEIAHLLKRSKSTIYRAIHAGLLNPSGASAGVLPEGQGHHGYTRGVHPKEVP